MKKIVAITCCLVIGMCGFILTGCGGDKYADSEYLGTWSATNAEYSGIEMSVSDILGGEFSITLNADGSAEAVVVKDKEKGSWEPTDKGVKIKDSSDELEFEDKDGVLVLDYQGVTMKFEKK